MGEVQEEWEEWVSMGTIKIHTHVKLSKNKQKHSLKELKIPILRVVYTTLLDCRTGWPEAKKGLKYA